jgi:hypothetical protein
MPYTLPLLVDCPRRGYYVPVTFCKKCPRYCGIINSEMLSCEMTKEIDQIAKEVVN